MKFIINKGDRKVSLDLTKPGDFDSSFLEKVFPFYKSTPQMDDIDVELHSLISEMWAKNYRTFNCCSGHGKVQGFIVFLPPSKRGLRAATWQAESPIPKHITELTAILEASIIVAKGDGFQPFVDKLKELPLLSERVRASEEEKTTINERAIVAEKPKGVERAIDSE